MSDRLYLLANGDLRLAANQNCWKTQQDVETRISAVLREMGWEAVRAHPVDPVEGHGFIGSQKHGLEVFRRRADHPGWERRSNLDLLAALHELEQPLGMFLFLIGRLGEYLRNLHETFLLCLRSKVRVAVPRL